MSMSDIESFVQDIEDLEEENEKADKESNNENMDNIELNENMDPKDFLTSQEKENSDVEDLEEDEEKKQKKKKKKSVTMMDPPKCTSSDSGVVSDFLRSKKEVKWNMVLLGLRIAAFVFCLISFSVLAANEQTILEQKSIIDWYFSNEQNSYQTEYSFRWYDYDEFKYSFTANVLGFVYSGLQICDLIRYLITKKHTVDPLLRGYFNISIDQALAYVLMSASSSAAAVAHVFGSYWVQHGANKFSEMANASVAMSFLAFVAFALTSLVSGFILSRFN